MTALASTGLWQSLLKPTSFHLNILYKTDGLLGLKGRRIRIRTQRVETYFKLFKS